MVFVWSQLTRGDPTYTLVQVSANDVIMIFAFAPIVALLLGVTDITVPWETLLLSVGLYILIPLAAGALTRQWLVTRAGRRTGAEDDVARFTAAVKPVSVLGLLATVVLLFGFQGRVILAQPVLIALLAVPLLIQSYGVFALAYAAAWAWRGPFNHSPPSAPLRPPPFLPLPARVSRRLSGGQS